MKRITITMEDELYEELELASEKSMRPVAVEALYLVKAGLDGMLKPTMVVPSVWDPDYKAPKAETTYATYEGKEKKTLVSKKGVKELPSQGDGEFKTYFKERKK